MTGTLLLAAIAIASAAADLSHISEHRAAAIPNLFNTPELRGNRLKALAAAGVPAGAGHRRLVADEDGQLPHVHDAFEFTGTTDTGFVAYKYNGMLRNTVISTDDYADLLATASFQCAALEAAADGTDFAHAPEGTAPHMVDNALQRNPVRVTVAFPAAADADAVAHLTPRFTAEGAAVVFGHDLLASHADFRVGTPCAAQIPHTSPYYRIARATPGAAAGAFVLDVVPTDFPALFLNVAVEFEWDPKPEREIERRKLAGLDVGVDLRTEEHKRRMALSGESDGAFKVNWSGSAAVEHSINILPGGALYCEDCYAYFNVKVSFSLSFCGALAVGSPFSGYYFQYVSSASASFVSAKPADCTSLGAADRTSSGASIGIDVMAKVSGSAGFGFKLKSDGITQATTSCQGDASACSLSALVSPTVLPPISFAATGVPISITPTVELKAAGSASIDIPGHFQMGASATVAVELGGRLSMPDSSLTPLPLTFTPYNSFAATYAAVPFELSGFTAVRSGSIDVVVAPIITLSVWNALPITNKPVVRTTLGLTQGTKASRLLRSDQTEVPAYSARHLAAADCVTTAMNFDIASGSKLAINSGSLMLSGLGSNLGLPSPLTSVSDYLLLPATIILAPTVVTPQASLASACLRLGETANGAPAPPAANSGATPDSSSGGSGGSVGAVVGGIIGGLVAVAVLSVGGLAFYNRAHPLAQKGPAVLRVPADAPALGGGKPVLTTRKTVVVPVSAASSE